MEAVRTKSIDDMQVQEEDVAAVLNRVEAVFYSIAIG
jgi:hypothetical protein